MDVSRGFFGKLRALALTLEKEARQLEQALNGEEADYEEESPIRVLHDLHCELKVLKGDVNASLEKSCYKRQEIHDFMKASKILMQRNASDLGKIRELFQKYSYKPPVKDFTDEEEEEENNCQSKMSVQNKSDQEKVDGDPHLPACTEKPPVPKDPLRSPQLSDFGLSQYAFSRTWSARNEQHTTNAHQEYPKTRTPLKPHWSVLPKTPKCTLKMDDYECVTPKLEHFGISEHTMCMNEDYTMALIRKTAQTSKNVHCSCTVRAHFPTPSANPLTLFSGFSPVTGHKAASWRPRGPEAVPVFQVSLISLAHFVQLAHPGVPPHCYCLFFFSLLLHYPHERSVAKMSPKKIMVTPGPKPNKMDGNADNMASPEIPVFCRPGVKIPSRSDGLSLPKTPETNEISLPSHTGTPVLPDFETRWLKVETKVVNNNEKLFKISYVMQGEKPELVAENDATSKLYIEDVIPSAISSDEYLKHFENPSPPKIKDYEHLINTPPVPEITRIPDDVLQILSKYNQKAGSSKAKKVETKAGNSTRYENDFTNYCNKENR
ncbi:SKA3 protein, partial [Crypturellus soui]|nr:SKA3 protein [Crypturellus soui]